MPDRTAAILPERAGNSATPTLLVVDTATKTQAMGLRWPGGWLQEASANLPLAEVLHGWLRQLDAHTGSDGGAAALDALAVATGPGGFTGLRTGLGFVQGLARALPIPCLGIASFQARAFAALQDCAEADRALLVQQVRPGLLCLGLCQRPAAAHLAPLPVQPPVLWEGGSLQLWEQYEGVAAVDLGEPAPDGILPSLKRALPGLQLRPTPVASTLPALLSLAERRLADTGRDAPDAVAEGLRPHYLPGAEWKTLAEQRLNSKGS